MSECCVSGENLNVQVMSGSLQLRDDARLLARQPVVAATFQLHGQEAEFTAQCKSKF